MAPKKAAALTSSSPKDSENKVSDEPKADGPGGSRRPGAVRKVSPHPPTMEMIKEALKALDSRKGVSAQAIRGFIKQKYRTVDENRVNLMVRKALVKGIESGAFVRPATSSTNTGAQGRFRLAVRKPKETKPAKKAKEAKENADPNVGKAKEPKAKETGAEKPKPVKKVKSAGEKTKKGGVSSVAPAKKPKAKQLAGGAGPDPDALETPEAEGGASGKAAPRKVRAGATEDGQSKGPGATALKKGGKKRVRKAPEGEEPSEVGGAEEQLPAAPPKTSARKGKKAA
ncbi:linker histone H1M [Brachyhypopomus gauderio]|uniref:linker histone H1M n=1 Tax=Brachyhypopomus gauderio TaxID=698409 RepID=UPI004042D5DB